MDLLDIFDLIISPILDLFVLKMPKEVWLKQLLLDALGLVCLAVAVLGWTFEIWILVLPGVAGMIYFFWRSYRVSVDWLSKRR